MARKSMERLPDSIVEHIFGLIPRSKEDDKLGRAALPLVCRNFNRIYRSSKLLWGTMQLRVNREASDEEVAGLLPSLRHKGEAVERLLLYLRSDKVTFPELMAHFTPEGLRHLELDLGTKLDPFDLPAGHLSCLGRLVRLNQLLVIATTSPIQDDLNWLCALKQLQGLYFIMDFKGCTNAGTCTSLSRLTALTELLLSNSFPLGVQLSSSLACLRRLRGLGLNLRPGSQQQLQLGAACFSCLQQLSHLSIHHSTREFNPSLRLQLGGLSTMPSLQELSLEANIDLDLQDLLRCSQLRCLTLRGMSPEPFAALEGGRLPLGSLQALTSLEWEPELRGAEVFGIQETRIDFPEGLCQLTQLQQLHANIRRNPFNTRFRLSVPAAFSQLRELRRLKMSVLQLREVPAAMTGLSKLECLDLSKNLLSAESFPPGPYLANLRCLNAHGNYLRRVPKALASATKLEALDISENVPFQFRAAHLALLPGLKRLYITKRLKYCSPELEEFESPAEMLVVLWSNNTLRDALQAQSRFPGVEFNVDKYMQDEEWWQREWASATECSEESQSSWPCGQHVWD